jgi:hypothetical protein
VYATATPTALPSALESHELLLLEDILEKEVLLSDQSNCEGGVEWCTSDNVRPANEDGPTCRVYQNLTKAQQGEAF